MKSIILLSGPVGAGKTTVAPELIASSPGPTAYIEGDKFWFFIAKDTPNAGRHKNFKTIMAAMTAAAVPYALAGYEVLLDFSIPPWFLETACKVAGVKSVPLDYVVLRPSESVCSARARRAPKGRLPITHLIAICTRPSTGLNASQSPTIRPMPGSPPHGSERD